MISKKGYYANLDLQFEIIHQHKWRETFFLPYVWNDTKKKYESTPPIRWLNASAIRFMQMHWQRYNFLEKKMNLYHSLATYQNFPTFSYNWRIKSQQQQIWLEEYKNYVIKYDLFVETDSPDIELAKEDTITVKTFLDKYKVKYYVKFSGSKGFHFLTPCEEFDFIKWDVFNQKLEENVKDFRELLLKIPIEIDKGQKIFDKVLLFKMIALRIKTLLACTTVDTSVQDVKRVVKSGYSLDDKSGLIAYPLDDTQLKTFNKEMVTPAKVLSYRNHKRGLLWRNTDVPLQERQELLKRMLVDLGILK